MTPNPEVVPVLALSPEDAAMLDEAPAGPPLRVVLVDDHVAVRQGLRVVLGMGGLYQVVAEASAGIEALRVCREVQPDIVVLDLVLPELCGVQLIELVRRDSPGSKVVVFTGAADEAMMEDALAAGPDGLVRKEDTLAVLRKALAVVAGGGRFVSPWAVKLSKARRTGILAQLSVEELTLLQAVAAGFQNKEIANAMGLTYKQVDNIRSRLMQKLDVHDAVGLTRFAMEHGLGGQ